MECTICLLTKNENEFWECPSCSNNHCFDCHVNILRIGNRKCPYCRVSINSDYMTYFEEDTRPNFDFEDVFREITAHTFLDNDELFPLIPSSLYLPTIFEINEAELEEDSPDTWSTLPSSTLWERLPTPIQRNAFAESNERRNRMYDSLINSRSLDLLNDSLSRFRDSLDEYLNINSLRESNNNGHNNNDD